MLTSLARAVACKFQALLQLSRYRENVAFAVVVTLLGADAGFGSLGWRLGIVLAANWLSVAFAFMINDLEDAADDALNPAKVTRNPVSARRLSPGLGWTATLTTAAAALGLYALLGALPLAAGVWGLLLGFLYSWKRVRLKALAGFDLLSHSLMLAGLQFLAALWSFGPAPLARWVPVFLCVVAISAHGVLFNQMRDLRWDAEAGLRHTAARLGPARASHLMLTCLATGVACALATIFWVRLVPSYIVLATALLCLIFTVPALVRARKGGSSLGLQQALNERLTIAVASALALEVLLRSLNVAALWAPLLF